jgi:uncharacterized membrane protein
MMYEQNGNISKEIKNLKGNQKEILWVCMCVYVCLCVVLGIKLSAPCVLGKHYHWAVSHSPPKEILKQKSAIIEMKNSL